jgi:hypothetical protein
VIEERLQAMLAQRQSWAKEYAAELQKVPQFEAAADPTFTPKETYEKAAKFYLNLDALHRNLFGVSIFPPNPTYQLSTPRKMSVQELASQFKENPNLYTQLGRTPQWEAHQEVSKDAYRSFVMVLSVVPGFQAAPLLLAPMDLAEGNFGAAVLDVGFGALPLVKYFGGAANAPSSMTGYSPGVNASGISLGPVGSAPGAQAAVNLQRANPFNIRFTQATASPNLSSGPSRTITELVAALRADPGLAGRMSLEVVEYQGSLYSLNNRRLAALCAAQVDEVLIQQLSLSNPEVRRRFVNQVRDGLIHEGTMVIIVQGRLAQAAARRFAGQHGVLQHIPLPP